MVKKMLLAVIFVITIFQLCYAKDVIRYDNLTGGKEKDKIVIHSSLEGNCIWYTLEVFRKTNNGWEKISSDNFPFETYNTKTGKSLPTKIIWSDKGGYVIDKFGYEPNKSLLIYSPDRSLEGKATFVGYFFKYDKNKMKIVLSEKNNTNNFYSVAYIDSNGKLFDPREKIIKEFKGKTNFAKAHETAIKFWSAIKKQNWKIAYSLCTSETKNTVESWKNNFNDQNIQDSLSINFMSWDGKFDENNKSYNFSGANNKMWLSIGVNRNLKIQWFMGEGKDVGL